MVEKGVVRQSQARQADRDFEAVDVVFPPVLGFSHQRQQRDGPQQENEWDNRPDRRRDWRRMVSVMAVMTGGGSVMSVSFDDEFGGVLRETH